MKPFMRAVSPSPCAFSTNRDVSFQTLMLDAIDLLLAREGEQQVGRWETQRRAR